MENTDTQRKESNTVFETSPNQKSIYAINQLTPLSTNYNITQALVVNQCLNEKRLYEVTRKVVNKYEALKASFFMKNGELYQQIHEEAEFDFDYCEVNSEEDIDKLLNTFVKEFDLSTPKLFRFMLVRVTKDKYYFVIDIHHIIADGISIVMLMHEILDENNGIPHNPVKYQQSDVIALKKRELLEKGDLYRDYWESRFCNGVPIIDLPFDRGVNTIKTNKAGRNYFEVPFSTMMELKNLCRNKKVTLFNLLLAVFYTLLYKLTAQNDIIIGIPVSGRNISASRKAVGMFVNTIPFRMSYDEDIQFDNLLKEVSEEFSIASRYQDYPIDDLIDFLNLKREENRNFLYDVLFSYYSKKFGSKINNVDKYTYKNSDAQFFLAMNVEEGNEGISIELEYYKDLFDEASIIRIGERYLTLLQEIIKAQNKKIKEINYLPDNEKSMVLYSFNDTEVPFDYDWKVYQMIEASADKYPDKTAIIFDNKKISYREMNETANRIGHFLMERSIKEGECVGILLERSDLFLEAILGIWKIGNGYIPMDTAYPEERIIDIVSASDMKIIITLSQYISSEIRAALNNVEIICMDEIFLDAYAAYNPDKIYSFHNIAYIIFTSGSTGKPKGAMIEQVGMTNHMLSKIKTLELKEYSVLVQNASQCFDISVWQMFNALISGGTTLILSDNIILNIDLFLYYLTENKVTVLEVVPSYLSVMIEKMGQGNILETLQYLVVTGEKVGADLVKKWFRLNRKVKLVNAYGPTEASDDITHYTMSSLPDSINIPIGKPIQNMRIYILDKNENLCGINVKGEIYTAGIGVGRGYIGDEEKTKENFLENPAITSGILYKTGDIGRWLPDGNIEYLERKDCQVKIRGFRIELGEIESRLLENSNISQAVVLDKNDDNNGKYLCAYVVADSMPDTEEIKKGLGKTLPYYMIPDHIIMINSVPITANGKTDRKKLLEIPIKASEKQFIKPSTWTQKKLALIWCEILNIEKISINDRFFELFGHSLKAIQMANLINHEFHVQFTVEDIFTNDTIAKQEKFIEKSSEIVQGSIKKAENREEFIISPAQGRVYSSCRSTDGEIAYNMPGLFEISGNVDREKVEMIFKSLIKRHSGLRSNFIVSGQEIIQKVRQNPEFRVSEIYMDEFSAKKALQKCVKPFNLEKDILLRVIIISDKEKKRYLFVDMHHIISDGVSMKIIVDEFIKLYQGMELPAIEYEYADYVLWQKERRKDLKSQETYWLNAFKGEIPQLDLVTDFQRPTFPSYIGKNEILFIEGDTYKKLKEFVAESGTSLHVVLMAVFKILLAKYTGKTDLIVGTVSAGRKEESFRDIIGMFVNTLPIRVRQNQNTSFRYFLKEVRKKMIEALENDEYQFDELVKNLKQKRDISRNPLFDVLFVMQDDYFDEIKAGDLTLRTIDYPKETVKFDMEFQVFENKQQLILDMCYKSCLFKRDTIVAILQRYKYLLGQIIRNPDMLLKDLKIADSKDNNMLLRFNDTESLYDINLSIIDLFLEKAHLYPNHVALKLDNKSMTYDELNKKSDGLATQLEEQGIQSGNRVAIIMDDCFEMIISILAILKVGAIYVPIDINFPENRVRMMLQDSQSRLLLYKEKELAGYADLVKQINIKECNMSINECSNKWNNEKIKGEDIACIVYTSGTTGRPKGNLILHKNIIRVVYRTNYIDINEQDIVLQTAHYGFDGSFFNIFGALLNGAELLLCSRKNVLDLDYISSLIVKNRVTLFFATTSLFNIWADSIGDIWGNVRCIVFGGEKASEKHCRKALKYLNGGKLINGYGPTESTVFTTTYTMNKQSDIVENIPIGKVITNTIVYILGINDQINPVGVPGELCIAGHGLVKGYTNADDLMGKKFVKNPHNKNEIIYRTGDLAMWREDGNVLFLGRMDNQVKINGYRIELEEIEAVLSKNEHVKDNAVIMKTADDGNKWIAAYYTSSMGLTGKELKIWMKQIVPQYMIPKYFTELKSMPLNQNGKIDRCALSSIDMHEEAATDLESDGELTLVQSELLENCKQILGVADLGLQDDFYERGGDSIKAIQLSAALKKKGLNINPKDILMNSVLADITDYIRSGGGTENLEKVVGEIRLLPVYQFFIERNEDLNFFNQSVILYSKKVISKELILEVFRELVNCHDMLRAVYNQGRLVCRDVDEENLYEVEEFNFGNTCESQDEILKKIYKIKSSMDLSRGPLLKAGLFKGEDGTHLLISIHHFAVDAVSFRIILDDITSFLISRKQNDADISFIRTNSFKDWVDYIYQYADSKQFITDKEYWLDKEKQVYSVIKTEIPKATELISKPIKESGELSEEKTEDLLIKANKAFNTETRHLLITALENTVRKIFAVEGTLRILLEGHGRENLSGDIDISRTVGWFTTLFPLLLEEKKASLSEKIKKVKDNINSVPNNGIGYGIYKYMDSDEIKNREIVQEEISFNYLGVFDNTGAMEGFSLSTIPNEYDQDDRICNTAKIEITAGVYGGKLKAEVTYSSKGFLPDTMNRFMKTYIQSIEEITDYCLSRETHEMTLTDFDDKDLNEDELRAITEIFG